MVKNRITEMLGIEYPVFQAPMAWETNAELVAAVSNAGGFGVLGPNAGHRDVTSDPIETAERMRREIHKTRELTDKPFSVNFLMPNPILRADSMSIGADEFTEAMFNMLAEESIIKTVVCTGVLRADIFEKFHSLGKLVIYRDGDPNEASFRNAEAAGADIVVATGCECGGHIPLNRIGLVNILQLAKKNLTIPYIAAGGIVDRYGTKAASDLGAEGVWIGTKFCTVAESPVSQVSKDIMVNMSVDDCIEFKGTVGFMRTNKTPITLKCKEMSDAGASREEISNVYSGGWRNGILLGDMENGFVSVNSAISMIDRVQTCKEAVDEFVLGMPAE